MVTQCRLVFARTRLTNVLARVRLRLLLAAFQMVLLEIARVDIDLK
jgi:hypothetical protein